MKQQWVIPPKENATFVCQVEAVLDLYHEPYDATRPVVCFDERPCQFLADVRAPLPMCASRAGEGQSARPVAREDYEYRRQGTTNVLLAVEPLTGQRIWVRPRRRKAEFAEVMRELADEVHLLLQTRTRVLNGELASRFREMYPGFRLEEKEDRVYELAA